MLSIYVKFFKKSSIHIAEYFIYHTFSCAKTKDVEPIANIVNPVDTTNNDLIPFTLLKTSGFILNEVLYDPPSGIAGDAIMMDLEIQMKMSLLNL